MSVIIEFCVQNDPYNMRHTVLMQYFDLVTLFDLTLTMTFTYYKLHIYMLASSSPGKSLGKVGFAAVISPVSAADKAKVRILTFDVTLTWHVTF